MVFQAYALFPNMTVAQNVGFGLKVAGVARTTAQPRVAEMLALIGLGDFGARYPFQLSGGQQQRVALARALAGSPQVLLLDEPLSALDAKIRVSLRDEIRRIQKELGITTIFVTHDQEEALSMSDRIVVMNAGTVEQVGTPFDIYNRPANTFVATFVGQLSRIEAIVTDPVNGGVTIAGQPALLGRPLDAATGFHARPRPATRGAGPGPRPGDADRNRHRGRLPRLGRPHPAGAGAANPVARHLQQPGRAAARRRRQLHHRFRPGKRDVLIRPRGRRDQLRPLSTFVTMASAENIEEIGEPDRIRTCDPLIKSQLLYQLSYGPTQGSLPTFGPLTRQDQNPAAPFHATDRGV